MRYPFRNLKGPVLVHYSLRPRFPKFHLLSDCEGFEHTPEEARTQEVFKSAYDLLQDGPAGRPCRMCALSSVLISVTLDKRLAGKPRLVSFTSQASPVAGDSDIFKYKYAEVTDSGKARIQRLAKRLGMDTVPTLVGPAVVTRLSPQVLEVYRQNLRLADLGTWRKKELPLTPVEVFWTLAVDTPPEINLDGATVKSIWDLSKRLSA